MKRGTAFLVPAMVVLGACSYSPAAVPVLGPAPDIAAVAGEWAGEYRGAGTGARSGSIALRLAAGSDTAYGDVVMGTSSAVEAIALDPPGAHPRTPPPAGPVLSIRFVRAEHGAVTGTLEPYADPDCGCQVRTTFSGRLAGDVIEGTYSSRHVDSGHVTRGRWRVTRSSR